MDFIFKIEVPPDEEVIRDFHRSLAKGLINKHGIDVMKKAIYVAKGKEY